jgi:hypothetical protein
MCSSFDPCLELLTTEICELFSQAHHFHKKATEAQAKAYSARDTLAMDLCKRGLPFWKKASEAEEKLFYEMDEFREKSYECLKKAERMLPKEAFAYLGKILEHNAWKLIFP